MTKFKPTISNIHYDGGILHFNISGTDNYGLDKSIINGIRRIILSEMPVVAFNIDENEPVKDITIVKNTGVLHNEMLLQRVSLIPLYINPINYKNNYLFELKIEHDNSEPYKFITAKDFNIYPLLPKIQEQIDNLDEDEYNKIINTKSHDNYDLGNSLSEKYKKEIFKPFKFERNGSFHYSLITELSNTNTKDEKQEIHLFGVPSVDNGKKHARNQSVSCATYSFMEDKALFDSIVNERIELENISEEDKDDFIKKIFLSESERYYYRDFENEPHKYNFSIKSSSYFNEKELFLNAQLQLINKIDMIKLSLRKHLEGKENSIDIIKKNNYIYHYILNNESHTIGNLIQSHIVRRSINDECIIQSCGYKVKHPLEESITLYLTLNPKNKICEESEQNKYNQLTNFLIDEFEKIKQEIKILHSVSEEAFLSS